jgi:hypothetical protein
LAKIIAPRSVDSFTARACASSHIPQFCVKLVRIERKLAFRHENARTPRVCRYFFSLETPARRACVGIFFNLLDKIAKITPKD